MLNKQDLITTLKNAVDSGSLLTPKHDPNSGLTFLKFRTFLIQQASGSLQEFIHSEQYDLETYYNKQHSKYSYKLLPHNNDLYTTVGFGILSGSLDATGSYDTFLIVSGSIEGWHIYSENSEKMQLQIASGTIEYQGKL